MKASCEIIGDLLPLYVESMASKESAALVEEHILTCDACKAALASAQESQVLTASDTKRPLILVQKNIRKRRIMAVLLAMLIVFLIMFTAFSYASKPIFIPYSENVVSVSESADGTLFLTFSDRVTDGEISYRYNEDDTNAGVQFEISAWYTPWDLITGRKSLVTNRLLSDANGPLDHNTVDRVYYIDYANGGEPTLIYGQEQGTANFIVLPRLVLNYYFIVAVAAAVLLGIAWLVFTLILRKKHNTLSKVTKHLLFIPVSYLLAQLLLNVDTVSYVANIDFVYMLIAGSAIYGIIVIGTSQIRQRMEDKQL